MKIVSAMMAAAAFLSMTGTAFAAKKTPTEWDKTFPRSDNVAAEKVRFKNRIDIELVGDTPMKLAIILAGRF